LLKPSEHAPRNHGAETSEESGTHASEDHAAASDHDGDDHVAKDHDAGDHPAKDHESSHGKEAHDGHQWAYTGANGPEAWGDLAGANQLCANGEAQSPVDLDSHSASQGKKFPEFHYGVAKLALKNNGHTLQADVPEEYYVFLRGKRYDLLQIHFHTSSEHELDGKQFPMEMHMVHKAQDSSLAVLGWFIDEGEANEELGKLWHELPKHSGESTKPKQINLGAFHPKGAKLLTYQGSLTTPPCSEGVSWMVAQEPLSMSSEQITSFAKIFPMNARPLQTFGKRKLEHLLPGSVSH
jgi:carbonic anhydrase